MTQFDNLPDMSNVTSDGPLMVTEPNAHQSDTEYLPTDRNTSTEQADESTLIQNHSLEDDHPVIQGEQLSVPSVMSGKDEENDGFKGAEPVERNEDTGEVEGKDGTVPMDVEENTDTNDSVRRSERIRQPPRRLDYTELGSPLVTAVKSFFQGLSTAWAEVISDEPVESPALSP